MVTTRRRSGGGAADAPAARATVLSDALAKPECDEKDYRLVELSHGLRALLISDPKIGAPVEAAPGGGKRRRGCCMPTQAEAASEDEDGSDAAGETRMAACAMCVGVGYLSDPPAVPGLAHFVEHMLFMGTARYPRENGWSEFLASHGGEDNGETSAESTVCYFDVHPSHLRAALARFASFYVAPLFGWGGSQREVQAIDSEFEQAKQADSIRADQVLCELMTDGHPHRRFGWGNALSLVDAPKREGVDVQAELRAFHRAYYSANIMTLAIIGREDLDTLQRWVEESCGPIGDLGITRPSHATTTPVMPECDLPLIITTEPLERRRSVEISWFLPPLKEHHRAKPQVCARSPLVRRSARSLTSTGCTAGVHLASARSRGARLGAGAAQVRGPGDRAMRRVRRRGPHQRMLAIPREHRAHARRRSRH